MDGFTWSVNISFDSSGNIAIQTTKANVFEKQSGAIIGPASAGVSRIFSITNCDTVDDLEGIFHNYGASANVYGPVSAGLEANFTPDDEWGGITVSGGVGAGVDIHASATNTETVVKFNPAEWIKGAWKKIKGGVCLMKKYAASGIIRYIFIAPLIPCLLVLIFSLMYIRQGQFGFLCFCVLFFLFVFFITIELILFHNAFLRIFLLMIKELQINIFRLYWDDALAFRIIEVNFWGFYPKKYSVDILCIGDVSANSFPALDPRKTIFISLNKRTKEIIRAVAGDKFPL
ncbi:MAG: hypothetical protein L6V84_08455 [Oscillospiraceae bacterium]|nr:MAG: hypothetical protein L6V84_08455 [Oscillospiraceae bacterium]